MLEIVCPSVILYSSIELSWRHDSWTAALVAIDSGSRQNKVKKERQNVKHEDNFFNRTIFTTQPTDHSYKHDQTWVGGVLPKLGQYRNTLIGRSQS